MIKITCKQVLQSLVAMLLLSSLAFTWIVKTQGASSKTYYTASCTDSEEAAEKFNQLEEEEDWIGIHLTTIPFSPVHVFSSPPSSYITKHYVGLIKCVPAPPPKG